MHPCELRHFTEPCLLLLLREHPSHGYELADRLRTLHLADGDSAGIYRTLRALEKQGLVRSVWRSSATGPARRTYSLTPEGLSALEAVTREVRDTRRTLDAYLDRYSRYGARPAARGSREAVRDSREVVQDSREAVQDSREAMQG